VSFPLEDTNLFYTQPPPIIPFTPFSTSSYTFLGWNYNITNYPSFNAGQLSGSGGSIYSNALSASYLVLNGAELETSIGAFSIETDSTYSFAISRSERTEIELYINKDTSRSSIFAQTASDGYISASYVPIAFNNYSVTFSIIGSAP